MMVQRTLAPLLVLALAAGMACDVDTTVSIRNETDSEIEIFVDGQPTTPPLRVAPKSVGHYGTDSLNFPQRIQAYDIEGTLIHDQLYSFDEIEREGFEVVIRSPGTAR